MLHIVDARKKFPIATTDTPRTTWVPFTWGFIEYPELAASYDFKQGFFNNAAIKTRVPLYYCPSDRPGAM